VATATRSQEVSASGHAQTGGFPTTEALASGHEEPFYLCLRQDAQPQEETLRDDEPFSLSLSMPATAPLTRPALPALPMPPPAAPAASRPTSAATAPPATPVRTSSGGSHLSGNWEGKARLERREPCPAGLPDGFSRWTTASTVSSSAEQSEQADRCSTAIARSWELVQAMGVEEVGESMLRHFFELQPDAEDLFTDPQVCAKYWDWDWSSNEHGNPAACVRPALRRLAARILNLVGCAVAGQHKAHKLMPALVQLGTRHVAYGAREEHVAPMGQALMAALGEWLGEEAFTPEVEHAWSVVYGFVSASLLSGMSGGRAAPPAAGQQNCRKAFSAPLTPPAHSKSRPTLLQHHHSA